MLNARHLEFTGNGPRYGRHSGFAQLVINWLVDTSMTELLHQIFCCENRHSAQSCFFYYRLLGIHPINCSRNNFSSRGQNRFYHAFSLLAEPTELQPQQLNSLWLPARVATRTRSLFDSEYKQSIRLDMALTVPAVRSAQRVIAHRFQRTLTAHEHLEGRLKLGEVLSPLLYTLVVLLELRGAPCSSTVYPSSSAAIASLTVR